MLVYFLPFRIFLLFSSRLLILLYCSALQRNLYGGTVNPTWNKEPADLSSADLSGAGKGSSEQHRDPEGAANSVKETTMFAVMKISNNIIFRYLDRLIERCVDRWIDG